MGGSIEPPEPPLATGLGGETLGIYHIVEVMTLPLGPIFGVNPHIYFVRAEGKRNTLDREIFAFFFLSDKFPRV